MNTIAERGACALWRRFSRLPLILVASLSVFTGCRDAGVQDDPLTETNVPRPTNEIAEKAPWVTNPPPR